MKWKINWRKDRLGFVQSRFASEFYFVCIWRLGSKFLLFFFFLLLFGFCCFISNKIKTGSMLIESWFNKFDTDFYLFQLLFVCVWMNWIIKSGKSLWSEGNFNELVDRYDSSINCLQYLVAIIMNIVVVVFFVQFSFIGFLLLFVLFLLK